MMKIFRSKIALALLLMMTVLLMGVLGYKLLYGYTLIEAIYMTIITVTTVGFSEVKPLDAEAKLFTSFLIVTSVFIFGYALSVITEYLLSKNSLKRLKQKKLEKRINKLSNHVVVCGFGRNGMQVGERLRAYKKPFVVIENDEEIIQKYEDDVLFVQGDANDDEILIKAGVERASYLISAIPDDAVNLFVVLTARQLNDKLFIISRAAQITSQRKLEFAGANKVVMPDRIGGEHMASLVVMPDLITFINNLSTEGENTTHLEEVEIADFKNQMDCNSIRDLDLRKITGCTIIGYVAPDGEYIIKPEADLELEPNGKVIVLGRPEQIKKLNQMFHIG